MNFIVKHKPLFYLLQFTWGLAINFIGFIVFCILLITKHKANKFGPNVYMTVGKSWGGLSLGIFFFVGKEDNIVHTKCHESGHSLQNIMFGPLFIFLVCIPSAIRYWYRELKYYRKDLEPKTKYDDIWFEGQATNLGYKYFQQYTLK